MMLFVDGVVVGMVVVAGIAAMVSRNLVSSVLFGGLASLIASYLFLRMGAPDVAMTEAAIGAALTTVIFLIAVRRTQEVEE